jgi:Copper type II ascorbate-dependent monooxygenase, C-terminal domain
MHYLNATDSPQMITGTAEFYAAYPEQVRHEADFLFIGNPDLQIGPGMSPTFTSYFTMPNSLAGSNFFAITGHTHQYGTAVDISTAAAAGADQPRVPIYAPRPFLWSEPETKMMSSAFQIPEGGGFDFSCSYRNPTSNTITFGESTDDEMCFFWAYYYPSKGSRVCVHTTRVNAPAGIDVCCPAEPGDAISDLVCRYITSQL